MPKLNSRGDWAAGMGGGIVSVNGLVALPYQSGGANWVDDDHVIGQVCDGEQCRLKAWNRLTGKVLTVSDKGANHIYAGGGVWAAWLGSNPATGVYTSTGLSLPLSGLGPVGPDGAIAIKVDYQSVGPWDVIERDGSRWTLTEGDAGNINLLGHGRAVWSEPGGVIAARRLIIPLVLTMPFYWLTVREIDSVWWVLYQTPDNRLLLHPFDSSWGYVVTTGNAYRPDFCLMHGSIRVVWAISEGEPPQDVRTRDIALTEARVNLGMPVVEEPMDRFWFQPNIASQDLVTLFDDPATLAGIDVFQVFVQNVILDGVNQGPNTWQALQANHVYQKLKQAGIPLPIEMGVVKPGDCQAIANLNGLERAIGVVREHKGEVAYISMDEPLTADKDHCHQGIDKTADAVAAFIHAGRDMGVEVGWIEAWPHIDFTTQRTFLGLLNARSALPAFWHLDIDWNRAAKNQQDPAKFLRDAQQTADDYGILLGIYLNATVDPIATDAAHHANVLALAQKVRGIVPNPDRLIVASWAFRHAGGLQDVPANLGPSGLLATYAHVKTLFGGGTVEPPPPPPPPEGDLMLPTYEQFVTVEGPQVDAAIGHMDLSMVLHTAWRRLNEGWTHANILRDLTHEPLGADHAPAQRLASPTYDEWLQQEGPAIQLAIPNPTSGDLRHNAYRRFVEGWTLARILHDLTPRPMFSVFTDPLKEVIAVKEVKLVAGTSTFYTLILPSDRVCSCQQDGSLGDRDPGTEGVNERCRVDGNVATFKPVDKYFSKSFVVVAGL